MWAKQYPKQLQNILNKVEQQIQPQISHIETIALMNQKKVLDAFKKHQISESSFAQSTGYGYNDTGREQLEKVYASVFGGEDALVRPQLISGTHAIATALYALLSPGEELIYATGTPYDTLLDIIGIQGNQKNSLINQGIFYQEVPLKNHQEIDIDSLIHQISKKTKVVAFQRSCGYTSRPAFSIDTLQTVIQHVKQQFPHVIIFVDNCYGEFVETKEPLDVGADLIAGSLIKNPGGGLAETGGYIVGQTSLISDCADQLIAPGIGKEAGAMLGVTRSFLQGFFLAPHVTSQAVKGAIFSAALFEQLNIKTDPAWDNIRTDIIQRIHFPDQAQMIRFCEVIQSVSPVDAHVVPVPWMMPGYDDPVIMASGSFIQGSSIELSADGPIRPPYTVFLQGGLTYEHVKLAITEAIYQLYFLKEHENG